MEPDILDRASFKVLGTVSRMVRGTETPEIFQKIWEEFESHGDQIEPYSTDRSYYGISFPDAEEGIFYYIAGMAVENVEIITAGLEIHEIPEGRYAVFECSIQDIGNTYRYIFSEWLPRSPYLLRSTAPSFEQYPSRESGSALVQIHIPIDVK